MTRLLAMLVAVVKKELRQTVRDRRMMVLLVAAPTIQLLVLGHAVSLDVDQVPTIVVDHDRTHASRTHLTRLLADGTLTLLRRADSVEEAERALETGEAAAVLVIPHGFERDLARGRPTTVQAILDGSDSNRSQIAAAAVAAYFSERSMEIIELRISSLRPGVSLGGVTAETRILFNPTLDTATYMVPGVVAMLLLVVTTIVTAMGLAREREVGTLEQILVTPVPGSVLILGKIVPFAGFGLFDFVLAMVVGAYVFDMPLRGDWTLLLVATCLYLLTTLGMGLLIATLSSSQQQAFLGGFIFMLPAALLSGILTPIHSMPEWMQPLTLVNPLRHYQEVLRAALLRGAGFGEVTTQLATLALIGLLIFGFATLRFRSSLR